MGIDKEKFYVTFQGDRKNQIIGLNYEEELSKEQTQELFNELNNQGIEAKGGYWHKSLLVVEGRENVTKLVEAGYVNMERLRKRQWGEGRYNNVMDIMYGEPKPVQDCALVIAYKFEEQAESDKSAPKLAEVMIRITPETDQTLSDLVTFLNEKDINAGLVKYRHENGATGVVGIFGSTDIEKAYKAGYIRGELHCEKVLAKCYGEDTQNQSMVEKAKNVPMNGFGRQDI